ncbi:MAG: hypothetical protein H6707_17495 [Deltaproteobacteria bacterium]|nr:hypothetical protein [Deltaproteobacteria bacterium]
MLYRLSPALLLLIVTISVGCDNGDGTAEQSAPAVTPASECNTYLACLAQAQPAAYAATLESYRPDGPCWKSAAAGAQCRTACKAAQQQLSQANPLLSQCAAGTTSVCERAFAHFKSCFAQCTNSLCNEINAQLAKLSYADTVAECERKTPGQCGCSGKDKEAATKLLDCRLEGANCVCPGTPFDVPDVTPPAS